VPLMCRAERLEPYRRLLREISRAHSHLILDGELHTIVAAGAVLITRYSTTGLGATIMMKKPESTLNFWGQPDRLACANSGAAVGVCRPDYPKPAMNSILENADTLAWLRRNQEVFIRDCASRMAGQAAPPIAQVIDRMATQ